ncbi:MAG: 1-acyl-sn-glycerol-3-phosphate acyltransferase [Bacteriovoracaceae bacterium]|nr:1-acyl-sn-glycerol-3-phosphate acyltransferase [Bacteriovoracaceae bacterium]
MEDVYKIVCSYEKVSKHLEQHPNDYKKVIKFIDEIKGEYNQRFLTAVEAFVDNTFVKLYDGYNVQLPSGFDLNQILEEYHVVLCPNHQSHADYVALQYIFYKQFRIPVYIAGGINLNIFPIGKIFRKCGAFFIRRKFDDDLYKITFQGYIYYLLHSNKVVEFFFEGGRTRTGKLLPPKYGLFSMILDAHSKFGADKKPLMFIPVSIAHEHIPEEAAHAKELSGAKKQKEKPTQLLKLFKLFNKKLGTVHVKFGDGIIIDKEVTDLKQETQDLAFKCFRQVGQGMLITPSSLLTLILLDEPSGALTWKQIEQKALKVIDYCQYMGIGLTNSLKDEKAIHSLRSAMDMFLNNEKVELIKREKLNQVFYTVNDTSRVHLLYHKNMILHHFFVPAVINATWFNIFNGNIKSSADLRKFLIVKRKELKYEFYLPRTTEMIAEGIRIIEYGIGRRIEGLDEVIELSRDELYKVAALVKPFSSALSYIYEAYYVSAITVKYLSEKPFTEEKFLQVAKELFEMEREHGRIVKYREAFTVPKMKATLDYLINLKIIDVNSQGAYELTEAKRLERLIEKFVTDVNDQVSINLKLGNN